MSDIRGEMPKKLGFGCMRLPILNGKTEEIDEEKFCRMVDAYMARGFKYFDTAYPYHLQHSEESVKHCLTQRYDRDKYFLADKMPVWFAKEYADYEKIFNTQLERCGVDYFDFYLLHSMNDSRLAGVEETGGFEFIKKIKAEGQVRHIGCSFHDSADALEKLLSRHPELEFVQLQLNYYDWESKTVQSRKCYETAVRHGLSVIVMEPVKGGTLADMIGEPARIFREIDENASYASFAIRFAASLENVMVVLSGMSSEEQLLDNISYMEDFKPLTEREQQAIRSVVEELDKVATIPCTKCRYCVDGCPKKIQIPEMFEAYNLAMMFGLNEKTRDNYRRHTSEGTRAEDCIRCGACEQQCPQHLMIRDLLVNVREKFA